VFWLPRKVFHTTLQARHPSAHKALSPTLALRDGCTLFLALRVHPVVTPQDQWALSMFSAVPHSSGYNLQEAIDAPNFPHRSDWPSSFSPRTSQPAVVKGESRFPAETHTGRPPPPPPPTPGKGFFFLPRGGPAAVPPCDPMVGDWASGRMVAVGRET